MKPNMINNMLGFYIVLIYIINVIKYKYAIIYIYYSEQSSLILYKLNTNTKLNKFKRVIAKYEGGEL